MIYRRFFGLPVRMIFHFKNQADGTVLATMRGYEAVMEDRLIRAFKPERYAAGR